HELPENWRIELRNFLVTKNLRLLAYFSRKKFRDRPQQDEDYWERYQDGYFGLNRTVEMYDPRFGTTFATYAGWRVKQSQEHGEQKRAFFKGRAKNPLSLDAPASDDETSLMDAVADEPVNVTHYSDYVPFLSVLKPED